MQSPPGILCLAKLADHVPGWRRRGDDCKSRTRRKPLAPSAPLFVRACLRNSSSVTCGKCDTIRCLYIYIRIRRQVGVKGRVLSELRGVRPIFPVNRKQSCRANRFYLRVAEITNTVSALFIFFKRRIKRRVQIPSPAVIP